MLNSPIRSKISHSLAVAPVLKHLIELSSKSVSFPSYLAPAVAFLLYKMDLNLMSVL